MGLLVFGSIWSCLLVGFLVLLIEISVVKESAVGATAFLLLLAFILALHVDVNIFVMAYQHPLNAVILVLLYFALGLCWALWKWYRVLNEIRDIFLELQDRYLKDAEGKTFNDYFRGKWDFYAYAFLEKDIMAGNFNGTAISLAPSMASPTNLGTVAFWITYWPFGLFWLATHDLIEKVACSIARHYKALFERMSKAVLGSITDERTK